MTLQRRYGNRQDNPFGNWVGIILMVVILVGLFLVLRGIFRLLYFLAPVLLIATLIIDYKVVWNYIKQLVGLFKKNFLWGLGAAALTFFLYPIVFTILLFRALSGRGKQRMFGSTGAQSEDEFVDYEVIDDDLDLDDFEKVREKERKYRD